MKKLLFMLALIVASAWGAKAQKLVIGSEVEGHLEMTDIEWLTDAPNPEKPWVIDFFSTKNPTSKKFYEENIGEVVELVGDGAEIVVITANATDEFVEMAQNCGENVSFGVDVGRHLHKAVGVEYIPYTVVLSPEGELLWQGNMSTAAEEFVM